MWTLLLPNSSVSFSLPTTERRTSASSCSPPSSSHHQLLRSLSSSGDVEEAAALLLHAKPPPDPQSCALLLHLCITNRSLYHAQSLHRHLHASAPRLLRNPTVASKLITLYSVCDQVDSARAVFDECHSDRGRSSLWVPMIVAYSKNGLPNQSLLLYAEMIGASCLPSNFAFSAALKACSDVSDIRLGRCVHAQMLKLDENKLDQVAGNALLGLYVECGCLDEACRVFETMPDRNVVSWNTLIAGFCMVGRFVESLKLFRMMQGETLKEGFSWVTLTTLLSACARLTALHSGKEVHAQMIKVRRKPDVVVMNALMDMYAKCGEVECCRTVFTFMRDRDLTSWNVMLTCFAINGGAEDALDLFDRMLDLGVRPDGVTFVALLSCCSHAGYVEKGHDLFNQMLRYFGILPKLEHYACLIDILGRSGMINEALEVMKNMPMNPSNSIWGSLLNSCRLHRDTILGKFAAEKLFELEPDNAGNYVILSNIYAGAKMWKEAKKSREMMAGSKIRKEAGCSWIQVGQKVHTFVAGGSMSLCSSVEYKRIWNELMEAMKAAGYTPDTDVVLHDIDDETKALWVCGHSERIALVFGLMHSGKGMPIRIMKNLRICLDCHNMMKMASRITERLIVLRDTNRFHHFHDGNCTCRDFW